MKQNINYNMLEADTDNGYGIQVHYTFTSFDRQEIEDVKEWCEKHISGGLVFEGVNFRFKSESEDKE